MKSNLGVVLLGLAALSGCGSDSGGGGNENQAPSVTIASVDVNEKSEVTLEANAVDTDGSIVSYQWEVTSDHVIELSDTTSSTLSFVAPEVFEDTEMTFQVTVTDAQGASATSQATVVVNQLTIPLTIKGLATDEPLRNAEVNLFINGQEAGFSAVTDMDGVYELAVELDDSQIDSFLSLQVKGVEAQSAAELMSLMGTVDFLVQLAGSDTVLDRDESASVNITNVTTAIYGLIYRDNEGSLPVTNEALEEAMQALDFDEVLELATLIKVAIDHGPLDEDLALPASIDSTLSLVTDLDSLVLYSTQVQGNPEVATSYEALFEDENLLPASNVMLEGRVYMLPPCEECFSRGSFSLEEDGTGTFYGYNGIAQLNWSEENGEITMVLDSGDDFERYSHYDYELMTSIYDNYHYDYRFSVISSVNHSHVLNVTSIRTVSAFDRDNPNNHIAPPEISESSRVMPALEEANIEPIEFEMGDQIAIEHDEKSIENYQSIQSASDTFMHYSADIFALNEGGVAESRVVGQDMNWSLEGGSLFLEEGSSQMRVSVLTSNGATENFFVNDIYVDGELSNSVVYKGSISTSFPSFVGEAIPGVYRYNKVSSIEENNLNHFWLELSESGRAYTISTRDVDGNGQLESSEVRIMYGQWSIDDGQLEITRYFDENGDYNPLCFDGSMAGCWLYNTRTWQLLEQKNNALLVYHEHNFPADDVNRFNASIRRDTRTLYKAERPVEIDLTIE
ncbi:PKD domain-containing protein [Marinibactrum halimedae]|uniref:PKD/Chitinase domain-containing protein n=1 Tax=Marinibactrum halimedae TaxID=1444977 RepID=A0AA37WQK3_9GAMM|nr:PKD domain-containing protein [Marinibactrum halimedae]MCD9459522.1 PKD domain-containing protein [Marinibactrum halimedae]GLS28176.1 hypothetical protein GCM10007877_38950 [Marinibactrum halimedae]